MKLRKSVFYVILLSSITLGFFSFAYSQDFLQIGIDKLSKKDYKGAIENFQKAVEKTPKNAKAYFYLAEAYFLTGQTDNSEINLKKAVDYDDEYAQAYKRLGDVYFQKKLYRDALKEYEKAVKYDKRNPDFLFALGKTLIELDSVDASVNVLFKARDLDPKNPEIYISLGYAYLKMTVAPMAIDNYKKAVELDSNNAEAHLRLGDVYMDNKVRMYTAGLNEYIKAVIIDSTNFNLLLRVSHLLYFNRLYDKAVAFYKKYTSKVDTSYIAYSEYGISLTKLRPPQYELAISPLEKALKLRKAPIEALHPLSLSYYATKNFKKAVSTYSDLIKFDSLTSEEYARLARSYISTKDTTNAISSYEKSISVDPSSNVYSELATVFLQKKMYVEAGSIFKKKAMIDTSISRSKYWSNAGNCYSAGKDYDNAREAYTEALNINPDDIKNHYYIATLYQQYGKNDSIQQAVSHLKEVIRLSEGQESEFKIELAYAYYLIGFNEFAIVKNYSRALDAFDKCLRYNERNELVLLWRAHCFYQLGQKEDACKALDRLLKSYPNNKDGAELQKKFQCWLYK